MTDKPKETKGQEEMKETGAKLDDSQQNQLDRQLQGAALGGELAGVPGALAQQGVGIGTGISDLLTQLINTGAAQRAFKRGVKRGY